MTTIAICTIGSAMSREQREALAEDMRVQLRSKVEPRVLTVPVGVKLEFAEVGHFGEAEMPDRNRIVLLSLAHAIEHQMTGAKVHTDQHEVEVRYRSLTRDQLCQHPQVWREMPITDKLTFTLNAANAVDWLKAALEPGGMYLSAAAVRSLQKHGYFGLDPLIALGAVVAE